MSLFKKAENMQAYFKPGLLGFAGSGKTYTASSLAIGLHKHIKSKKPVYFLDTETGSDWVKPRFDSAEIELFTSRTRAFADLVPAVREAEKEGAILIIDSITHFWREWCDTYQAKRAQQTKNQYYKLQFQDWAYLKAHWGKFTDAFVNSSAHIIMCGRAGYEYDFQEDDDGKKELIKTGVKMKAETEMGYEPSLLILMERVMDVESKRVSRVAHVLKDRSSKLDGKSFNNPNFETFKPHIQFLNIGGVHMGTDTGRTSEDLIGDPKRDWKFEQEQKELVLTDLETLFTEHMPGRSDKDKAEKIKLLKMVFGYGNWERIKLLSLDELKTGHNMLTQHFERAANGASAGEAATLSG